jgi:hypothetical protein
MKVPGCATLNEVEGEGINQVLPTVNKLFREDSLTIPSRSPVRMIDVWQ